MELRYSDEELAFAKKHNLNLPDLKELPPLSVGKFVEGILVINRNMSVEQVAEAADIDPAKLQEIIADKTPLDIDTIKKIDKAFEGVGVGLLRHQFSYEETMRTGIIPSQRRVLALHL